MIFEKLQSDFQHLFTDVSQLLRTPIDPQLDEELIEMLKATIVSVDYADDVEKIKLVIQTITDLLNDLKTIEYLLLRQWAHSLKETCKVLNIDNSILGLISDEIKCENYVALSIHLIRMRTILQERVVNIEEKETTQWDENIHGKSHEQQPNRFLNFLNEPILPNETSNHIPSSDENDIWAEISNYTTADPIGDLLFDKNDLPQPLPVNEITSPEESFEYSSLFELSLKLVPLISSPLFQQIHEQPSLPAVSLNKAQKFTITHTDGKVTTSLWKRENIMERLRKLFEEKKYDMNNLVFIDKNEILLDCMSNNTRLPRQISLEYSIIEKTLLFKIEFLFRGKLFEYFSTSKSNISIIIDRFITDNDLKPSSAEIYLCFFDQFGKSIENETIADLINRMSDLKNKTISITVTEEHQTNNSL